MNPDSLATAYDMALARPDIAPLHHRCRVLAVLEAIISPEIGTAE